MSKLNVMENRFGTRVAIVCALLCGIATANAAQTYSPPPPPLTTLPPCQLDRDGKPLKKQKNCDPTIYPSEKSDAKKKSPDTALPSAAPSNDPPAAQKFPFPGEQPSKNSDKPAAQAFPYPGSDTTKQTAQDSEIQHDPAAEKKATETPAGKAYPFPRGSTPDMPADPDMPAPEKQADGAPGSSSSSSSSSSTDPDSRADSGVPSASDAPGPKGEYDDDDSVTPKLKEKTRKNIPKPLTDAERVDEDLSVANFYGQSGNKMGAYLRAKDAVKIQPEYPEGHFVLGEAALRLGKKDEATAEFKEYLRLAPDGDRAKSAEKALDQIR